MNNAGHVAIAIIGGIIGLAVLAVVLSSNSNTTNVVSTTFSGFTSLVKAAIAPITG